MNRDNVEYFAAVVGAGPAGLFAARELVNAGIHATLFNRDIRPGGLAEYGIYPKKHKMKEVLRVQFRQALEMACIDYYGNVTVGNQADLTLDQLRQLGFQAIMVTAGAQGTKWLKLPGEDLRGVYHAKDLVYHYNGLPPYSEQEFEIGRHVAIVGVGNVMTDIARYLIEEKHVESVTAIARRGPGEIKFERKELGYVAANLDIKGVDEEIERAAPLMWSLGENPDRPKEFIHTVYDKAVPTDSKTRFMVRFLLSPTRILGDADGRVRALEVEENTLICENGDIKASGTGRRRIIDMDTVIFAIGDSVDEQLGLPVDRFEFVKNPQPRFEIEGNSYEAFDPETGRLIEDVFLSGWARRASTGLVGIARKDGIQGARAMIQYIQTLPKPEESPLPKIEAWMHSLGKPLVSKQDLIRLECVECEQASKLEQEEFRFTRNEEMLAAIRRLA
ncbi:MAG: FAD-dependent oxidoreductase [Anaerolineaceae bacterium]|nr:FAD-dependent oxidoreductase [Anaerolineaceae bacterium]